MNSLFDELYYYSPCNNCRYNYDGEGCSSDCMLDDFVKTSDCIESEVETE